MEKEILKLDSLIEIVERELTAARAEANEAITQCNVAEREIRAAKARVIGAIASIDNLKLCLCALIDSEKKA